MSATIVNEPHELGFPFIGRDKELAQLVRLHARRRHVLILGPEGVGKSDLVRHAASLLPLVMSPQSDRLSNICGALERQLGLVAGDQHLLQRKHQLLRVVAAAGKAVVFDEVRWTTPKLSSFMEGVSQRVPVWIVTRSEHSWDIGHIWPLLCRFAHVELRPFHQADTREVIERLVKAGRLPVAALAAVQPLHRMSAGVPRLLRELLEGVATGSYDLRNGSGLKLLDLDRRIQSLHRQDAVRLPVRL
jgi:energy-coupling factor transporter ATP-binding protein EcfA2